MKNILFLAPLLLSLCVQAQVDSLGKATEAEKASALSALYQLEEVLNCFATNQNEETCKPSALKMGKEAFFNTNVQMPNDLELPNATSFAIFQYAKLLGQAAKGMWTVRFADLTCNQLAYDKLRRKNFMVVKANKITSIHSIEESTGDTLIEEVTQPMLFYLRFDRVQNISSNFRIFSVTLPGKDFKLEPLPELVEWWLGLDKAWKEHFRKLAKLPEYPSEVELLHFSNRNALSLSNTTFNNLAPLSKFQSLKVLDLRNSAIEELLQLKELPSLSELYIEGSNIKTLQGIESQTSLRKLTASKLNLTSIEPLRNLTNLEELYLAENNLDDISPLENMANLRKLDLSLNNNVRNVQVLAKLKAVQELSLAKIDVKDLSVLKEMKYLDKLNIFNTGITTLEPLRGLNLSSLDCGFNVVSSLDPIKGMGFMQYLNVAGTAITDLNVLSNFKFLKRLDCSNNPRLTALGPVIGLEEIEELKCHLTKIDKNEVQQFKRKHVRCKITFY